MLPSENEDNTLQIKEKSTERTTPFFVLEVTARSAADILGIHPNSAVLFYRKIRMVITHRFGRKLFRRTSQGQTWSRCGRKSCCLRHYETQRTGLYSYGR